MFRVRDLQQIRDGVLDQWLHMQSLRALADHHYVRHHGQEDVPKLQTLILSTCN